MSLQLVVSAASPARHDAELVLALHGRGWRVQVIATAAAAGWLDPARLRRITGRDVLVDSPADVADLVLVVPATFHTVNRITAGAGDGVAVLAVQEGLGRGTPIVVAPHVSRALADNPFYVDSIARLEDCGVVLVQAECEGGCAAGAHLPGIVEAIAAFEPPAPVMIRRERPEDAEATAAAHIASWQAAYADLLPEKLLAPDLAEATAQRRRVLADARATTFVAADGAVIAGHVGVRPVPGEPAAGEVFSLYLTPEYWGTVTGDLLIDRALHELRQRTVRLWALRDNPRAITFYERHGFEIDQEGSYAFPGTGVTLPDVRMSRYRPPA
jgi:ribosomal protein S18 acetylase RimI-like enzyme